MGRKILLGCGLPLVVVGMLLFLSARALLKPAPKTERSETASRGDVEIKVVENGTIEPLKKVEIKSKVGGRIAHLFVDEGMVVRKGQLLATIDPQEVNSQVAALQAQLASAQAKLAEARKNAIYQQAQTSTGIDQYRHNVANAAAHLRELEAEAEAQPKLTQQSIDIAQANLEAAQAALKAQQDSLNLMVQSTHPQAVVSAQAAYDQAKAQLENARRNLQREQQLLKKGYVPQSDVDTSDTDTQVAEAHLRDVKEHLDRIRQANALEEANARSQVANALGQVRQMEAALAQAKTSVLPITMRRQMDSARAAYEQAKAQLAAAEAGKTQDLMRGDDIKAAAADARQIQNQLDQLLVQQNDTRLVAPMTGVVTKRYIEVGELVTSGISSFSSGTPIYQIGDLATMLVTININEVDINKVRLGMPAEVTIDAARGVTFLGHVHKVAPAALTSASASSSDTSASSSASGTNTVIRFAVEIQIDHADVRLKPGMSAHCAIMVARHRNVLRVPTNCVQGTGGKGTVQIVTSTLKQGQPVETTTARPVTIGLRGDDFVEITSGVNEGEKIRPLPYTGPPRKAFDVRGGPD
ncbi:MAG TPA: efflux RND transporter periplasmic adaptor subunit [Chthonomonadaceae bacterium]|nr:efflux RND transporter periplasmic adaptor subunit [Chthonomonadaceae bacterium]